MLINIIIKLPLLRAICFMSFIYLITGCSTVKRMPDELPDVKYSGSPKVAPHKPLLGKGSLGTKNGTGNGNGKGTAGNGNSNGNGQGVGTDGRGKNDQAGKKSGNKSDGTGETKASKQKVTNKAIAKGRGKTQKVEDEVAGFLNLDSPASIASKHKGLRQGHGLPQENSHQAIPLINSTTSGNRIGRRPSAEVGKRLIADLKKSGLTDEKFNKPAPRMVLAKPRRRTRKFVAAPPVLKKVDDSFMPYQAGQIITLDTNLVPAKRSVSRIICLYSGGSVYLSFKTTAVKMGGLYVRGKFKVRGIVKENFSGKEVPVAILDKL